MRYRRSGVRPHNLGAHRDPIETTDRTTGRPLVLVPLANTPYHAVVYHDDYRRVIADGNSPHWSVNGKGVVVASTPTGPTGVARLIVQPTEPVYLGAKNKNRLDLRRENIRVRKFNPKKTIGRPKTCTN